MMMPTVASEIRQYAAEIKKLTRLIAGILDKFGESSPEHRFIQLARLFSVSDRIEILALQLVAAEKAEEEENPR